MNQGFEKLAAANAAGKHLCVGFDANVKHIARLSENTPERIEGNLLYRWGMRMVSLTARYAAAFKANLAFWVKHPTTLRAIFADAKKNHPDVTLILDAKNGDIANTEGAWADFAVWLGADAVTVNPYMGIDDVTTPFLKAGIDCFVLGRTSNPGAAELQRLATRELDDVPHTTLAEYVCTLVNDRVVGGKGLGLVVGATDIPDLALMRANAPVTPFLIPGVGAQGGDLKAVVAHMRKHEAPWVVNVGRGIAEVTDNPTTWEKEVADVAMTYHDQMVP